MSALGKSSAFAALGFLLLSFSCRGEDNAPYVYGAEMCTALRKPSVALSVISCHLADSSVLDYSTIPGCSEAATNLAFLHSCYCNFFLGPYTYALLTCPGLTPPPAFNDLNIKFHVLFVFFVLFVLCVLVTIFVVISQQLYNGSGHPHL
ncbi:hypothetical protein B0T24DRAFT_596246 [Lasiosphaeria ovina]|uniref:Uncharacterized protein n=1 Tax=Lasiosphaeria ovina TaxID=92902 RepID=A0AAE0N4V2_9PEZI|nr:hypothetical protein B0T24DRAFT_596246 [Lasiosphaeria ovina]